VSDNGHFDRGAPTNDANSQPANPAPGRHGRTVVIGAGIALAAAVVTAAATQAHPGPRLSRKDKLVDLIAAEDAHAKTLRAELDSLRAQLDALQGAGANRGQALDALKRQIDALAPYAGLAAVRGPGLKVELRDSTLRTSPTGDPNDLVIHQQDIQSVVNALWAAGAEAMAINGQRVTAQTAIRCVGNTLLLHGSVYSPPYDILVIGDPSTLRNGLAEDLLVQRFQDAATQFRLGFTVSSAGGLTVPAFEGISDDKYAVTA
jgi:uncharacterized protein YlxW (UPF0749 family)